MKPHLEHKYIEVITKHKILTITILIFLVAIIYIASFASPKIDITTQVKSVTNKDFDMFVKYSNVPIDKKIRDNCRFVTVEFRVLEPLALVRNIKIERVTLSEYLNNMQYVGDYNYKIQGLGNYYSESTNKFSEGIDVYLDGMTDKKIKDYFKDYKIEVTWMNIFNVRNKAIYYLKDYFN